MTKKKKMDRDLSGARPSALCVCFSYFARAAGGDVVYGLDDRNRAGICGIEKLHISFYRRYRVSAEYYQHDHLDPAAVNGPCVYRNNSGTDLKKAEMVYKLNERGIMIPNIISSAALGMLFLCIMNPQFGMVNNLIRFVTGSDFSQNWFLGADTAFFSVTLTWLPYAGLVTILVMAEMASIPEDIYEAARVDGATDFQIDIRIVLPMMRNIIGTATVLAATSMLQKLDIIMMTTNGGPAGKTMNMPMYLYQTALTDNNYGLANAQGVVLIAIGLWS